MIGCRLAVVDMVFNERFDVGLGDGVFRSNRPKGDHLTSTIAPVETLRKWFSSA